MPELPEVQTTIQGLQTLLNRLPNGLDGRLDEKGLNLSGGEIQRIGICRALIHDPEIIFTPECSNIITGDKKHLKKVSTTQDNCPVLYECMQFAKTHNKFISIGSLLLQTKN